MSLEETLRLIVREELERAIKGQLGEVSRNAPANEPLITITQAAADSGYSPGVIRKWLDEKKLTRHGSGRLTRIDPVELRALLRQMGNEGSPEPTRADIEERAEAVLARIGGRH